MSELRRHQDTQGLAKVADGIFKNKPVDQWLSAAQEHLSALHQSNARPLSDGLEEKFLEYVQERQRQAQLRAEFENLLRHPPVTPQGSSDDHGEVRETLADLAQMGLDLVGIFDPSPIADGANTGISLIRGDLMGAGISAAGMIPYLGDLAKLGKLGKYPQKIARAIALAAKSEKAKAVLAPVLKRLQQILNRIPLDKLPKKVSEPLERMKRQLDEMFKPAEKSVPASRPAKRLADAHARPPDANLEKSKKGPASNPDVNNGNLFNRVRAPKYPHNELRIESPDGKYFKLDSYNPKTGEIVSRKMSQLSDISDKSAIAYVKEAARKYKPGARILDVPSSGVLAGQKLRGQIYLEVPIQSKPISPRQ